jgi:hypothetical protein
MPCLEIVPDRAFSFLVKTMKTYVITLSQVFPSTHARAGEPTFFRDKLHAAITGNEEYWRKVHTIRANYELWKKRFEKIEKGEACLSIRQWEGKPYRSKQVELMRLTRENGIGIQTLQFAKDTYNGRLGLFACLIDGVCLPSLRILAENDGLSLEDWAAWFKDYELSKPMAIIHFTKFRY